MSGFQRDANLRQFATERQWEILEAYSTEGTTRAAAEKLGVHQAVVGRVVKAVKKKAALAGYSPQHDMTHPAPDGFSVKDVSTYYSEGAVVGQWVKTSADKERQEALLRAAMEGLAEQLPKAKPTKPPERTTSSTMACYPIGDHHLGMYSWHEEAGENYDLSIGEKLLSGAFDHLVGATPACDKATIVSLGDFLHYDSMEPVTPTAKNSLDSDGRFSEMVRVAFRSIRYAIDRALKKHKTVHVIIEIGNHDLAVSVCLMEALSCIFENEPRVTVDTSPRHFHYFDFGKTLVGVHHGHGPKLDQLPLIMATDQPKKWGGAEYRYWWTGHIHKQTVLDIQGCRVESFRTLPPNDAWAANKGYRGSRNMTAIVLHEKYGEVARHVVNPDMIK